MPERPTYEILTALALELLLEKGSDGSGEYSELVERVANRTVGLGLLIPDPGRASQYKAFDRLSHQDRYFVEETVRQALWTFLIQGILVFGSNANNQQWPRYRLTPHGELVFKAGRPQPYDPDGFIAEFRRVNPAAHLVIVEYLEEAVRAFNHRCYRSAAVMTGCVSEKAILLLADQFELAIKSQADRKTFQESYRWTIQSRYRALKAGLDNMVSLKLLPRGQFSDIVSGELPSAFEIIRRARNAAGHPEMPQQSDPDSIFLTLRICTHYVRALTDLETYFATNAARPY
jgi:hypothetical protein